ncbi:MAG: histidinol-phosphate transaminase [Actinomycetota bacterium]|nr:histidinol-phosphate transaminase [Candidatus Dormibacteraeota bacterium]MDQ6914549.1 histidinol-phosphate transaminase [Actinomycetota bacterium]
MPRFDASRRIRAGLRDFAAYVPGRQPPDGEGWIKLNTNESPWPPSPRVLEAIRAAVDDSLRLYPSPVAEAARTAIAGHHGVSEAMVSVGNGGDELLELCFRAFAGSGDRVAIPHPTYPLLEPLAALHEARAAMHPLRPDWRLPASFAADEAPLKFLVNPNSPTGTWFDGAVVRDVVERSAGVVVLDEAYVDFAPEDRLDLVREGSDRVIVVRTFSKSHALAGMRIGYAVAPPELISALDLVRDSYSVDRLAIAAAAAAIADREHHDALVAYVVSEREWLVGQLVALGFEVLPSATNFVCCRPPSGVTAAGQQEALGRRRVLVRHYAQAPLEGWLRITVGTRAQHESLLRALETEEVTG